MVLNENIWPEGLWIRAAAQQEAPCIMLMHGLGASKEDLAPLADFVDPEKQFRWVLPDAPVRPVTLNGGRPMRAWYDIYGLGRDSGEDAAGMEHMATRLAALMEHEQQQAGTQPLILGGFSQGGAMALYLAFHHACPAAAVLAFSAYLPLRQTLPQSAQVTPIFWGHGRSDTVLPLEYMEIARDIMGSLGYGLSTHIYPMDHSICAKELVDARKFLDSMVMQGNLKKS
ncbi:alpha/beta fold hydrolase [Acidithiobacillus thiooxidans]|uniref:alpha/beta hydrolase n=1 Tax=Acidithiobacillus thiooxidans TaxID=930 RepID=UPI00285C5F36|nr:alpha/beta fold hydrolase [Acidithiobacillus thiooxidans]MDR7927770.1 alpha/beta fold hydrolase [Acidithiobacillus thiooxidans]